MHLQLAHSVPNLGKVQVSQHMPQPVSYPVAFLQLERQVLLREVLKAEAAERLNLRFDLHSAASHNMKGRVKVLCSRTQDDSLDGIADACPAHPTVSPGCQRASCHDGCVHDVQAGQLVNRAEGFLAMGWIQLPATAQCGFAPPWQRAAIPRPPSSFTTYPTAGRVKAG